MLSSVTYQNAYTYLILNIMRGNNLYLNALEISYIVYYSVLNKLLSVYRIYVI